MTELSELYAQLPQLATSPHRITSPATDDYNCVAWVTRDLNQWLEPDISWPDELPDPTGADDLDAYLALFRKWGYEECDTPDLEDGFLKIAIYVSGKSFHHVAKQLPSGAWSSKAGTLHDVRHEHLDALQGAFLLHHSEPSLFMRRPRDPDEVWDLEETGLVHP